MNSLTVFIQQYYFACGTIIIRKYLHDNLNGFIILEMNHIGFTILDLRAICVRILAYFERVASWSIYANMLMLCTKANPTGLEVTCLLY